LTDDWRALVSLRILTFMIFLNSLKETTAKVIQLGKFAVFALICGISRGENGPLMRDVIEQWRADDATVQLGLMHCAGENAIARKLQLLATWEQRLADLDFDAMDVENRIDWILLQRKLIRDRNLYEAQIEKNKELREWLPFSEQAENLLLKHQQRGKITGEETAEVLENIRLKLPDLQKKLEHPEKIPLTAVQALAVAKQLTEWKGHLDFVIDQQQGFVPDFTWWVKNPWAATSAAMDSYAKQLREKIAKQTGGDDDPLIGSAVGATRLAQELAYESIDYTADELIAFANREFAWCEAEMKKNAREMNCGDDWKKALEKVKNDHAAVGTQDEMVRDQALKSIAFVKENDLVTVPPLCEEFWNTRMSDPATQKMNPYVAYGGQGVLVAFAHEDMNHEDKQMAMRGNNLHFLRVVVAHELIPGHHLQRYLGDRNRPWRGAFNTPFLVEGWALHWEMRLWDLHYPQTPEDRIGFLFWKMHRCARIIVSLNFHLGKMTPEQMIQFLIERVGHEKLGATSEVRRYISGNYSALYQCGYLLGGIQLNALQKELVRPGKLTEKQFHDRVLTEGPIPIELIRAAMLDQKLPRDAKPQWRFIDDQK
jgi:Bacterial protein of unknown function (DUF885)